MAGELLPAGAARRLERPFLRLGARESEPFEHQTPHVRLDASTNRSELKRVLLRAGGVEIARWFYPWKPETMTEENRDVKLR